MAKTPQKNKPNVAPAPDMDEEVESAETQPAQAAKPLPSEPQAKRSFTKDYEFDHDLFKLSVATMKKNVSWNESPMIEQFEHCHMFHTVDSNGRKQSVCTPVGGHFHEITVHKAESGVPVLEIGPPRKWVQKKRHGKFIKVMAPVVLDKEDGITDNHTHEYVYLGSEKIKARATNTEFAKFESQVKAKREQPVEGVV